MELNSYFVNITKSAEEELPEIYEYISNVLKSKIAADNLVKQIDKDMKRLSIFPYSCEEVTTKPRNTIYRKLPIKNHVVLYKICEEKKRVDIIHIYYGKGNYL